MNTSRDFVSECSFRLNDPPKGIFVTQLGNLRHDDDERESDDENVKKFEVVQENGASLLKHGVNTFQRTLLLKQKKQCDEIDKELQARRNTFNQRLQELNERNEKFRKKQAKIERRIESDSKFIKESNSKRQRAITRYQQEVKHNERLHQHCTSLSQELDQLKKRHAVLKDEVIANQKYEVFMNKIASHLPEDYLKASDSKLHSIMLRHRTLHEANDSLIENMTNLSDTLKDKQKQLQKMKISHSEQTLDKTMEIEHLREQLEQKVDHNKEMEHKNFREQGRLRLEAQDLGMTVLALNNLGEKCRYNFTNKLLSAPITDIHDYPAMLKRLEEYYKDQFQVLDWVKQSMSEDISAKDSLT